MGSQLKRLLAVAMSLCLISQLASSASAATKSATPIAKPTAKPKVTATAAIKKASATPTTKATIKTTAKPTVKVSAKPAVKATATKKVVVSKPKPRKKVKLSPSPKPVWPPKGYVKSDDIYAKVPTSAELVGLSSANKKLANDLKDCENLTCGAILATSLAGCNWWEITGDVIGPASDTDKTIIKYGTVASLYGASTPKEIKPFILVSEEPIKTGLVVSNINMLCHRDPRPIDVTIPNHTYVKNN
jgi:hypothetical protein